MNIVLRKKITYLDKIKDMDLDPINKRIITTGEKLSFLKGDIREKELMGKIKNCEIVKYIKEQSQFFVSSNFFVSTLNGKVFKCDSSKMKITELILDLKKVVEFLNFTENGKIIYVDNNKLYSYNPTNKKLIFTDFLVDNGKKGNYKIFVNGENIILKYRGIHEQENIIKIFDEKLRQISEIKSESNHIYSIISELNYISGTQHGEIEIWNILEKELYNSVKITDSKITYIKKYSKNYFVGTEKGEIIILDENFSVLSRDTIFKDEICKICIVNTELFALSANSEIAQCIILEDNNDEDTKRHIGEFINKYNINKEYYDFFSVDRVVKIENFLKLINVESIQIEYIIENIFRIFKNSISSRKICIIEKENYSKRKVESDIIFDTNIKFWNKDILENNVFLKNILKLIYKTYTNKLDSLDEIIKKIGDNKFEILPPNKLFEYWINEGILFLNYSFINKINKEEYINFFNDFFKDFLEFISYKNNSLVYIFLGKETEIFEKNILVGDIIKSNHPSYITNLSNEKDFLNSSVFKDTQNIINWSGFENNNINNREKLFLNKLF